MSNPIDNAHKQERVQNMNGKTRFLCLATACACLFFTGCAVKGYDYSKDQKLAAVPRTAKAASAVSTTASSRPSPPPGMSIGQAYVSALNENCYEVFSDGRPPQTYAMCYRNGAWDLSPGIFMSVPQGGVTSYSAPSSAQMPTGL
jgi:hypothetical protein